MNCCLDSLLGESCSQCATLNLAIYDISRIGMLFIYPFHGDFRFLALSMSRFSKFLSIVVGLDLGLDLKTV